MNEGRYDDQTGRHLKPVGQQPQGQMVPYDPFQGQVEDDDTIDLREYWRVLVKRRWVIASVLAILMVASLLSTILMIPEYRSTATIQITPPNSQILDYGNLTSEGTGYYGQQQFYATQ